MEALFSFLEILYRVLIFANITHFDDNIATTGH